MTEKELRQKVVSIATAWLGRKESDGSYKQIIDLYNSHRPRARGYAVKYTDEWCATFVSAVFISACLTDIAPTECSCQQMIEAYKNIGRWQENDSHTPAPGDVIMYDWQDSGSGDNTGWADHTGIVTRVSGRTITVIEGNKSGSVAYRTMTVGGKYIRGYCLPDYASQTKKDGTSAAVQPARAYNSAFAKTYKVTAYRLNMRAGAGVSHPVLKVLEQGDKVTCYGYYTQNGSTLWLYVKDAAGTVGHCSMAWLE